MSPDASLSFFSQLLFCYAVQSVKATIAALELKFIRLRWRAERTARTRIESRRDVSGSTLAIRIAGAVGGGSGMVLLASKDTTMAKLSDTQSILLSNAAQREDGSLYPLPKTIAVGARASKALTSLLKAGFAEEREVSDPTCGYRRDGDISIGVFVTKAALIAIGVEEEGSDEDTSIAPANAPEAPAKPVSKRDMVIALLTRDAGATQAELIAATGWLPHTTRAALTGLRKAGHSIDRGKRDDETCYTILAVVTA